MTRACCLRTILVVVTFLASPSSAGEGSSPEDLPEKYRLNSFWGLILDTLGWNNMEALSVLPWVERGRMETCPPLCRSRRGPTARPTAVGSWLRQMRSSLATRLRFLP